MTPPVIITRAEPGALETAKAVRALGLKSIVSPALSLQIVDPLPMVSLSDCAGILFTSANGVRFFVQAYAETGLPAWCVGPATYAAAKAAGFSKVENADGDSRDLAQLVIKRTAPQDGHLIHVANTAAGDILQSELAAAGFDVRFAGLYSPLPATRLDERARHAISNGPACIVIHSRKGAEQFAQLVQQVKANDLVFVCVSEKASIPIKNLGDVLIARKPNEEELLRVLKDWQQAL